MANRNETLNEDIEETRSANHANRNLGSTPSMVSPVGTASNIYSVALDEDDVMDLSPLTSNHHPPLHTMTSRANGDRYHPDPIPNGVDESPGRRSNRFFENETEIGYGDDASDDLPRPLLDYNYDDDDDDDDEYRHRGDYNQHRRHNRHSHRHGGAYHPHLQNNRNRRAPKLNGLNYLNVITYVLNVFTSYFIGVRGLFGRLPTRRDIFVEYETLVTPADYAFFLWAPILVFEFFFATAQLFPHYRARPIIQQGTGLYFFWACIIQTVWTVFFAMKWFVLSFVAVVLALLCLVLLLASQHYNCLCVPTTSVHNGGGIMAIVGFLSSATGIPRQRRKSLMEYWFFRFPFYLHCGWLLVCMVVQFSMVFRYRFTHSTGAQLMADIVSLGVLLPPGTFFLTGQSSGPDFVIPLVIIWSYVSIGVELHRPSETLVALYGHPAILAVQNASWVFTGLIGVMLIPRIIVWIIQEFCTIDVVELNDDDEEYDDENIAFDYQRLFGNSGGHQNLDRRNPRIPVTMTEDEDEIENNLTSVRRRIGSDEYILEEENPSDERNDIGRDNEEERYEDCQETENVTNTETTTTNTELTEE